MFPGATPCHVSRVTCHVSCPGWGVSGADWLVQHTTCVGVGVDSLSIELGRTQDCYVHRTLTGRNKVTLVPRRA